MTQYIATQLYKQPRHLLAPDQKNKRSPGTNTNFPPFTLHLIKAPLSWNWINPIRIHSIVVHWRMCQIYVVLLRCVATVTTVPHVRVMHTVNLLNTFLSLAMNLTRKIQSNIIKSTHLYSFTINTHLYRSYIYTLIYIVHILYTLLPSLLCSPQHNGFCNTHGQFYKSKYIHSGGG